MQVVQQRPTSRKETSGLYAAAWPALLLLICVCSYWKLVLTNQYTWLDGPDIANQVLPWYQFQAGEWHQGRVPLWDPYLWGGQPLVGQMITGAVYPPNWLLFLAPLRNGWIRQSYLHWYFVLIHFQAALFCYWLCRDLRRSQAAALLAGLAFGLGGFVGTNIWPQMLNGAVWAPLVLLFFLRAMSGERPVSSAAWSGACLGIAFLSGHHQIPIFISLTMAGAWRYYLIAVGQVGILRPVGNRPAADEQTRAKSADAIGAQDAILPHNFSQFLTLTLFQILVQVRKQQRFHIRLFQIRFGDHARAEVDAFGHGDSTKMINLRLHRLVSHPERILYDHGVDGARLQILHHSFGGIERDHVHLLGQSPCLDGERSAD
jgi:hypothetical protein